MKLLSVISAVLMLICTPLRADSVGEVQVRNADLADYRVLHEKTYDATRPMQPHGKKQPVNPEHLPEASGNPSLHPGIS